MSGRRHGRTLPGPFLPWLTHRPDQPLELTHPQPRERVHPQPLSPQHPAHTRKIPDHSLPQRGSVTFATITGTTGGHRCPRYMTSHLGARAAAPAGRQRGEPCRTGRPRGGTHRPTPVESAPVAAASAAGRAAQVDDTQDEFDVVRRVQRALAGHRRPSHPRGVSHLAGGEAHTGDVALRPITSRRKASASAVAVGRRRVGAFQRTGKPKE